MDESLSIEHEEDQFQLRKKKKNVDNRVNQLPGSGMSSIFDVSFHITLSRFLI